MLFAIVYFNLSSFQSVFVLFCFFFCFQRVSDRLSVCRKEIRTELGRLEKQFSRSYTLLQLHQQKLTEQFCSTAIDAITPLKNMVCQSDEFMMMSFICISIDFRKPRFMLRCSLFSTR